MRFWNVLPPAEVARINEIVWARSLNITPTTPFDGDHVHDEQWEQALIRAEMQLKRQGISTQGGGKYLGDRKAHDDNGGLKKLLQPVF